MSARPKLTDVPRGWADKPDKWWAHVRRCDACSTHYRPPGWLGMLATPRTAAPTVNWPWFAAGVVTAVAVLGGAGWYLGRRLRIVG